MSTSSVPTAYPPARFIESLGDYLTVDELAEYLQVCKKRLEDVRVPAEVQRHALCAAD